MASMPNCNRAIIDLRKIEGYCLDPAHPRGRHKARVLRSALGLGQPEAVWLRDALLQGARTNAAERLDIDMWGSRWRIDVPIRRHEKHAVVRTLWLVRTGEDVPRFLTCWVLR
jgi:Domain of unknown function (DUF6883)